MRFLLGSSSKWRQELFRKHFADYGDASAVETLEKRRKTNDAEVAGDVKEEEVKLDFLAADIDEKAIRHENPKVMTQMIAKAKAQKILPEAGTEGFLICLDQVLVCDGEVREKPENEEEARRFLRSYADGRPVEAINGVVVVNLQSKRMVSGVETAKVFCKPFDDSVIDRIIARKEVLKCAGGFMIDDEEVSKLIDRLEGTEESVMGLPLDITRQLIEEAGRPRIKQCIFDMDGLLLDTENAYMIATNEICAKYNTKPFTWELKAQVMGKKAEDGALIAVTELGLPLTVQEFIEQRAAIMRPLFENSKLLPGVENMLTELKRRKIPMCVATSSTRTHFNLKTTNHRELFETMFDHIVTGDDVQKGKPDPEIFLKAMGMFKNDGIPEESLVFEDSPLGIAAGIAGGFRTIMVPDHSLAATEKRGDQVLESMTEFDADYWC